MKKRDAATYLQQLLKQKRQQLSKGSAPLVNQNSETQAPQQQPEPDKDQLGKQLQEQAIQAITQFGTSQVAVNDSNIVCISIIGQIEGHLILPPQNKTTKYEHIIPQLIAAEQNSKVEGILVVLNTVGGDVEAGLAIAELISTMTKPSVTLVLGGGHSIGAPIAVSGNVSFIAETATMTIHPIRMTGLVIGVPQSFEYLEKMQERVTKFITTHSNIDEQTFKSLMYTTGELTRDIGTTIIGEEAVKHGLIDRVGGIGDALSTLKEIIEEKRQNEHSS